MMLLKRRGPAAYQRAQIAPGMPDELADLRADRRCNTADKNSDANQASWQMLSVLSWWSLQPQTYAPTKCC